MNPQAKDKLYWCIGCVVMALVVLAWLAGFFSVSGCTVPIHLHYHDYGELNVKATRTVEGEPQGAGGNSNLSADDLLERWLDQR